VRELLLGRFERAGGQRIRGPEGRQIPRQPHEYRDRRALGLRCHEPGVGERAPRRSALRPGARPLARTPDHGRQHRATVDLERAARPAAEAETEGWREAYAERGRGLRAGAVRGAERDRPPDAQLPQIQERREEAEVEAGPGGAPQPRRRLAVRRAVGEPELAVELNGGVAERAAAVRAEREPPRDAAVVDQQRRLAERPRAGGAVDAAGVGDVCMAEVEAERERRAIAEGEAEVEPSRKGVGRLLSMRWPGHRGDQPEEGRGKGGAGDAHTTAGVKQVSQVHGLRRPRGLTSVHRGARPGQGAGAAASCFFRTQPSLTPSSQALATSARASLRWPVW